MKSKNPSLFSAISLGIGSVVGSGWLFACYYAAKDAGPGSIFSWIVCAALNLFLALLLTRIAIKYPEKSLFSRLLSISHNPAIGFVMAAANWLTMIMLIPSEAAATVQYTSTLYPEFTNYFYNNGLLTIKGMLFTDGLIIIYALINYFGIKTLAKVNNLVTTIKLIVPIFTAITILVTAFHGSNFTSYKGSLVPYGIDKIFSTIITSGMFYTFSCFYLVTTFAQELDNPKKNLPIALSLSVIFCLLMYMILQIAFIGAVNPQDAANGWHTLNFTSPLAELSILLGLNWLAIILYADATLSPSGAGIIYTGVATRMLNGMADDNQTTKIFTKLNLKYNVSHTSLFASIILSIGLVCFFNSWHKIMLASSVFILLGALAIPIAFSKLYNQNQAHSFNNLLSKSISLFCFCLISYLLITSGVMAIGMAIALELILFIIYLLNSKKILGTSIIKQILSAWTIFAYLVVIGILSVIKDGGNVSNTAFNSLFLVLILILYVVLLKQKNYEQ